MSNSMTVLRVFPWLWLVASCSADNPSASVSPGPSTTTEITGTTSASNPSNSSTVEPSGAPPVAPSVTSPEAPAVPPSSPVTPPTALPTSPTSDGESSAAATSDASSDGETPTSDVATSDSSAGGTSEPTSAVSGDNASTSDVDATTACDYSEPPPTVAAWVDESWEAELGNNIRGRSAWLLDNIMQGEGEINLCVRWGATSAPTADVKTKVAPAVERWMNDWFTSLAGYGCFPYPEGVKVKVTGWAVRPGKESWVSDLDSSIKVYTETDPDGEPKCADACSFFVNWEHQFPNCPGGEAFHTDYWIWVSDDLPGEGAAAVGGDWGLRMPVDSFLERIDSDGDLIIEHEIGHGFGIQDYYSWTGSTPEGGSLMIVGSTNMQTPTVGDVWLLRRTWREMQPLRGW